MDINDFRASFVEFSNVATYPNLLITNWSTLAEQITSAAVYGTTYDWAVQLCTAHCLSLAGTNAATGAAGGAPGGGGGVVSSKSVGDVSVSYDTTIGMAPASASQWNATTYGRQYWDLSRLFGAGCVQL
jgi:membrane protease subunit (stomatin/prohibitin family)